MNSNKLIDLLKTLYSSTSTSMNKDSEFNIESGVRQGGPESPILFNLYIDYVMRELQEEFKKSKVKFFRLKYSIPGPASDKTDNFGVYGDLDFDWVGYADDLVMAFADNDSLRNGIKMVDNTFKRFINVVYQCRQN